MLSILIVESGARAGRIQTPHPSVEILHADGVEEALEKLGRNRRIDAVLLAAGAENPRIARAIREDNPAPPSLVLAEDGVPLSQMLDRIVGELEDR